MLSYNELKERHDTIKDFGTKYRKEITEFQAWVCGIKDLSSSEDYKRLVDEWTLDEFIGNLMNGLFNYDAIQQYKKENSDCKICGSQCTKNNFRCYAVPAIDKVYPDL